MSDDKTLEQWQVYANHRVHPFIIEKNDANMLVYRCNGYDVKKKPDNWKQAMAIVNGDWTPIPPEMVEAIDTLIQVKLDQWNPWPQLAGMKDKLEITLRTDNEAGLVIKTQEKSVTLKVENCAAIWTRWTRIGFEHDRLVWFAALLAPTAVNLADPWLGLMQWKQAAGVRLAFATSTVLNCIQDGSCSRVVTGHAIPLGIFTVLVPLFNSEGIPPGCTTDWNPFCTADEAIALLKVAYGTPEFDKLLARFKGGKMRRA